MPQVDLSDISSSQKFIDFKELVYKQPNNADILQSREHYGDDSEIEALKSSILQKHLLEMPIVMKNDDGDGYRVLEGNRRCYVLGLLIKDGHFSTNNGKSLFKVRCEVRPSIEELAEYKFTEWKDSLPFPIDEQQSNDVRKHIRNEIVKTLGTDALIRNTQRLNWSPVEQARKIKELIDAGESLENMSKQFGLTPQTIQVRLNLLAKENEMPEVIEALDSNAISLSTAKLLANVHEDDVRKQILNHAIDTNASHEETKALIDDAHNLSVSSGGKGIKTQNRNRSKTSQTKTTQNNTRNLSELNEALASLIGAQHSYSSIQEKDSTTERNSLNLDLAIKVIQWVIDAQIKTSILDIVAPTTNDSN